MTTALTTLRRHPQPTPMEFLKTQPGCWIQYFDDTGAKNPAKALSARSFDLAVARRKQRDGCSVCFSLQPFGRARVTRELLCLRTLGIDVDLVAGTEKPSLSAAEIDGRKEDYLQQRLLPFPLKAHWLIETKHGFHALFRVEPQRSQEGIADAAVLNARLVRMLQGDQHAVLLTQLLRVPNTLQFKDPRRPFLCRLLIDNAATIIPYTLNAVRGVLDALDVFHGEGTTPMRQDTLGGQQAPLCREGLAGVAEGQRNATAASLVGRFLRGLPVEMWEVAWGGVLHWNASNRAPLPERELRSVFDSIARRERVSRARGDAASHAAPSHPADAASHSSHHPPC